MQANDASEIIHNFMSLSLSIYMNIVNCVYIVNIYATSKCLVSFFPIVHLKYTTMLY